MILKVVDLFAGGGGLSLGFINAGYEVLAAFDNWKPAIRFYKKNFPNHPILDCDLTNDNKAVKIISGFSPDVIIGGPPCQDFSSAGRRDETLGRATLTVHFAKIVKRINPKWFVMENVDRAKNSSSVKQATRIFRACGYGLTKVILDASRCGVPQKRKRFFIIGEFNGSDDALVWKLINNQSDKPTTIRDYFGNKIGLQHYYRHPRTYKRRAIFSIDEPSPTIRGVNRPVPDGYHGHPGDSAPLDKNIRPLTTKERCLIQTFPDDFVLQGCKTDLEQIIGNAVPVKLAEYVANALKNHIKEQN